MLLPAAAQLNAVSALVASHSFSHHPSIIVARGVARSNKVGWTVWVEHGACLLPSSGQGPAIQSKACQ